LLLSLIILTSVRATGAPAQASADGYLTTLNGEVMFIQLTRLRGRLTGQMQIVSLAGSYVKRTKVQSVSFSGVVNNNQVSLVFRGFLTEMTIVGTLTKSRLSLSLPQADGRISVITFVRATTRQYNMAVAQLQRETAKTNRDIQQANYEKAVNDNIGRSFEEVSLKVRQLKSLADFAKELESFKKHWSDMEGHAREFRSQLSANPPASSEASYSLSNLTYDRSNIRYDRSSLDYKTRSAFEQIKETRQAMERLARAWSELRAAIAEDRRGAIRRDISQELVSAYIERALSEIRRVEGLIESADAEAKKIEKQADGLLLKSKESFDRRPQEQSLNGL
jgi:hypothetical protein